MFHLDRTNVALFESQRQPVSTLGAIALASQHAQVRVTLSSFRTYVSRGEAPAAVLREGRQPFWNPDDIRAWAESFASRTQRQDGDIAPPPPLLLSDWREVRGTAIPAAGEASELVRAYAAREQLPSMIASFAKAEAAHATSAQIAQVELDEELDTGWSLSTLLANSRTLRAKRATREGLPLLLEAQRINAERRERATAELEHVEEWIAAAEEWVPARAEQRRRQDAQRAFEEWLQELGEQSRIPTTGLFDTRDFAILNPARVSYLTGNKAEDEPGWRQNAAEVLAGERGNGIVLAGADFGYKWLLEHDLEDAAGADNHDWGARGGWDGRWRLSWAQETGELYFETRTARRGLVALVGRIPDVAGFQAVYTWLAPFEALQRTRGAYALLMQEIQIQESTGWRGLSALASTEETE